MRRITATLAAALIAGTAALSPVAAQAQTFSQLGQITKAVDGNIAEMDCGLLRTALVGTKMVDAETTRSGLAKKLKEFTGNDITVKLLVGGRADAVADRALACNIVKPDPVTPTTKFIELSSNLSSQSGLPELRKLAALSS